MYVVRYSGIVSILTPHQTAALGVFNGLNLQLPDPENLPEDKSDDEPEPESKSPALEKDKEKEDAPKDDAASKAEDGATEQPTEAMTAPKGEKDWVVVLGGASSVGKYAIQVSHQI